LKRRLLHQRSVFIYGLGSAGPRDSDLRRARNRENRFSIAGGVRAEAPYCRRGGAARERTPCQRRQIERQSGKSRLDFLFSNISHAAKANHLFEGRRKMLYALVPILLLSLLTGAKADPIQDAIRDRFVFPCNKSPIDAKTIGLPNAQSDPLTLPDGKKLIGFYLPPKDESHPLILYFHGNGGFRDGHFKELAGHGYGVMAYAYRGYHGSEGTPNEADIQHDAELIYAKARASYLPQRIVIMGESIGSGVATILASRHEEAALVLDSPYDNIPMVGWSAHNIPTLLGDYLFKDKFYADEEIGKVKAPVFMSVGCKDDQILPVRSEALYDRANGPKKLIVGASSGHVPLSNNHDMMIETMTWIDRPSDGHAAETCL
jgi:uncharacterized protein